MGKQNALGIGIATDWILDMDHFGFIIIGQTNKK